MEILFFETGTYTVGFELNKEPHYCIKFEGCNFINAYGCTYNFRSPWIYKTVTACTGYSIRKKNWKNLIE